MKPRHYRAVTETKEISGVQAHQKLPHDVILIGEDEFEMVEFTFPLTAPDTFESRAHWVRDGEAPLHIRLCNRKTGLMWEIQVPRDHKFRVRRVVTKRVGVSEMKHKGLYGMKDDRNVNTGDVCMALVNPLGGVTVLVDPETLELISKYPSGTYEVWEEVT